MEELNNFKIVNQIDGIDLSSFFYLDEWRNFLQNNKEDNWIQIGEYKFKNLSIIQHSDFENNDNKEITITFKYDDYKK